MRTLIDIPEGDLKLLKHLSKMGKVSRAELVRQAISTYLGPHRESMAEQAFGIWKDEPRDGLAYQEKLRSEWER